MRQMRFFLIVSLFFVAVFHGSIKAQVTPAEIDRLVNDAMSTFNVAGAAVAVVKDGAVLHKKGYGVKSIETGEKVNEHTNFAIASNTKAFTTAALAILVDEGKLTWQDRVRQHIPEFKMYNDYVTENFNIQDLLTHRSGLGLGAGDLMVFPDGADFTMQDVLTCFQYFEPVSAFRTKYDYDNHLYKVAGEVIKRVSGMSWENFVQERILKPLNMDNSYTALGAIRDRSNVATPHSLETGALRTIAHYERNPEKINGASGAIFSNVDDLCNWMLVQLNGGKYGKNLENRLFSEASHREMWTIHTIIPGAPGSRYNTHFSGYGLGWRLQDIRGNMMVSHNGAVPGMLSRTVLIPDLNLGIAVLTNTGESGSGVCTTVTGTIIDRYLGLDDYDWLEKTYERYQNQIAHGDTVTEKVWQTVQSAAEAPINPADYTGVYEDNWFGKVDIFLKDEQLWFRSHRSPKLNGPMYFYKANAFAIRWEYREMNCDAFAIFSLDEEGQAQRIRMKGISPNIDFSFDFQDLDLRRVGGR